MNQLPVSDFLWLQIASAASGCIDGTLADWPHLQEAFRQMNIVLPPETGAVTINRICLAVVSSFSCQDALDRIADLAKILVSGTDCHGTPIKSRAMFTKLLQEIISETNVPRASGHRWDFR